jgi:hypothetical protein
VNITYNDVKTEKVSITGLIMGGERGFGPLTRMSLTCTRMSLIDPKRNHGVWLVWSDINSHEAVALLLIGIWLGLITR